MTILELYKKKQECKEWYIKFQSTGFNKSGKIFSYINTNYRYLKSFYNQFSNFENNNGTDRKDWEKYSQCGQEVDKHRVSNLINSGLFENKLGIYYITNIGYVFKDLIEIDNKNLSEKEKWILTFLILTNYSFNNKSNEIIFTSKMFMEDLFEAGLNEEYILTEIKKIINVRDLTELFSSDIFWYITFAKDKSFIEKYKESTYLEKRELQSYLINEQKNPNSEDCIGHKYKNSGAYNKGMFVDEVKVLYYSYFVYKKEYSNFEEYINMIIDLYKENNLTISKENVLDFIKNHKVVYEYIYNNYKF